MRNEILESKDIASGNFDRLILSRLKLRDEAAFDYIYRRWEKPLFRFVLNFIGTQSAAEDICQETFAKLWLTCDSIDPDKNIKTYIFLISKQLTLNYIRDQKRKNTVYSSPDIDDADHTSPDKILEDMEVRLLIEYAIHKLPPQMRKVFELFYFKNMSHKQIASTLNMSLNNVTVQIHKARTKLERDILPLLIIAYTLLKWEY